MPAAWNSAGLKNAASPFSSAQLDVVLGEISLELGQAGGEVARQVGLRVRQVERRSAFERHVAMGDGALQRQHRRELVDVHGIAARCARPTGSRGDSRDAPTARRRRD